MPQYRGAAPINWAVINGEKETGITTFFLKHEIDTGAVIQQVRIPILETDNVGDVHDKLMMLGGQLVTDTVDRILDGTVKAIPQEEMEPGAELKPAPKIFKETCRIDWEHKNLEQLYNFVRGLSPYPAAWTELLRAEGEKPVVMKIYQTTKEAAAHSLKTGAVCTDGKSYLKIAVDGGFLVLQEIQIAGKKRMPVTDFLRGARIDENYFVL